MDEDNRNLQEQEISNEPFYDIIRHFEARRLFNGFIARMNAGSIRNDGSDELLSIIDKYVLNKKDNQFRKTIPKGRKLFRARIVKPNELILEKGFGFNGNDILGFNETESREPPLGLSKLGRNNTKGSTYLYLSNRKATACAEVKPGIRQIISLAEFETVDNMKIIDFSSKKHLDKDVEKVNLNSLFTEIMGMYCVPVSNDNEYYATQYLSDYVRKTGIDGISYSSYYDEKGVNYTIFNSDHRRVKFCGSRLILFQSERKLFLDLNTNKSICSNSVGKKKADANTTISIRNQVMYAIAHNSNDNNSISDNTES